MADYQVVSGRQLGEGYDADYYYAVYPDGRPPETMYGKDVVVPNDGTGTSTGDGFAFDPSSVKTLSELKAAGVKFSGTDAHGIPLPDASSGYRSYLPPTTSGSNNALLDAGMIGGMALLGGTMGMAGTGGTESAFVGDIPLAAEAGTGTSIFESASAASNFASTGEWDAAMEGFMGSPETMTESLVNTSPQNTLLADSGQIMTDVSPGLSNPTPVDVMPQSPTGMPPAVTDTASVNAMNSGDPSSIGKWWDGQDPFVKGALISGAMQMGGGVLKGIGDRETLNELEDRKLQNAKDLEEWKRRFTQSGSYFDATNRMKPGSGILRRPDGRPVYAPGGGLVNGGIKGGG